MIGLGINVIGEAKEYPEMTHAQVVEMCRLMNEGMSETEAKAKALEMIANE